MRYRKRLDESDGLGGGYGLDYNKMELVEGYGLDYNKEMWRGMDKE